MNSNSTQHGRLTLHHINHQIIHSKLSTFKITFCGAAENHFRGKISC
jgi:hypothetical protein